MSLIADALKTAQREKQRRDSGASSVGAPLLVPLRKKPQQEFSWGRALTIGLAGGAILASSWILVGRLKARPRAIETPLPLLLSEMQPVLGESAAATGRNAASGRAMARRPEPAQRAAVGAPRLGSGARSQVAPTRPSVAALPETTAAVPQGQQVVAEPTSLPTPAASGALRISVERPRDGDLARLFTAAVVAQRNGDLAAARDGYERLLVSAPNDVDALNNLGVLLSNLREFERAEQLLRRAVSLSPRNASLWNNLGNVLRDRGESSDAIVAFQRALSIDPRHPRTRVSLAQQYVATGSLPKARQLLEEVLADEPALPEALYTFGQVLELQGDQPGALRAYESFIRTAPPRFAASIERVRHRVIALRGKTP